MHKVPGFYVVASLSLIATVSAFHFGKFQSRIAIERKADKTGAYQTPGEEEVKDNLNGRLIKEESSVLDSITLQPIGKIASVYRLCVGTPRQGLLAPNSRGRIDLNPNRISADSIIDLDKYSHVWIVFVFHLNSNEKQVKRSQAKIEAGQETKRQFPAKIAPPALGGKKVGIFATRTPHRPNPVGFTLCKIDKIVKPKKKKHLKSSEQPYSIFVSGLDLVDGTPVLDIKPYVPHYDSVGYPGTETSINEMGLDNGIIPQWVSDGLEKRRPVEFSHKAIADLETIMNSSEASQLEFYGAHTGRDSSDKEALSKIRSCVEEVLSVDVRSSWQTGKVRKGRFRAERAQRVRSVTEGDDAGSDPTNRTFMKEGGKNLNICTQQLDRLMIKYSVESRHQQGDDEPTSAVNTEGSGADDFVTVRSIELIPTKK